MHPPKNCPFPLRDQSPRVMHGSLGSHAEQRIDWFGRFGTVQHSSAQLSVRSRHADTRSDGKCPTAIISGVSIIQWQTFATGTSPPLNL